MTSKDERIAELEAALAKATTIDIDSEAGFHNLVEAAPMGVHMYRLEPAGRLVFTGANPAADRLLGVDNSQFIGQTIEEAFPPLVETEVPERYRAAALEGKAWQIEQIAYDEGEIQGAFQVHAFQTCPGNMAAIFLNITERKQREAERERLLGHLNRLVAIIDNSDDFVSVADLQGQIIYTNPPGMAMVGRPGQDPTGMQIADLHPPEMARKILDEYLPIVMEKESWSGETTLLHVDGTIVPTSQVIMLIRNKAGEPESLVTIARDMGEFKRAKAEREHLQQEALEAHRRAIQELSTPVIPIIERIIIMPLVGSIDSMRARDITRALLAGIREHQAQVVIMDITGVSIVDSGVANHLNKTIQAARLKGARTIVTGISDAVAETIVDLGIDWGSIDTLNDLQTGLVIALRDLGLRLVR